MNEITPTTITTIDPTATSHQLVIFTLGDEDYALPISQIKEVIRFTRPRRIAASDPRAAGVITVRDDIVPIGDLGMSLGVSASDEENAKVVITETTAGTAGIVVDAVEQVLTVDAAQIDTSVGDAGFIYGIAKIDGRLVVLLDAGILLEGIGRSADTEK
jgi:purine-binding chemotaxis protein CheW